MKSTKTTTEAVAIGEGGSEIRLTLVRQGRGEIQLERIDGATTDLSIEDVERIAEALASTRRDAGDYRRVCADHGYFGGLTSADYACPTCRKDRELEQEALERDRAAGAAASLAGSAS